MITISILGLDQFLVGDYSREITHKLADAYEIEENEIVFYAPQAFIFHKGYDQSSYNVIVKVDAEKKFQVFERIVFSLIKETLSKYVVHLTVQFNYFESQTVHSYKNPDYPVFMDDSNVVYEEYEDDDVEESEVYDGNIFENLDELIEQKRKEVEDEDDCECGHHHCDCKHHN